MTFPPAGSPAAAIRGARVLEIGEGLGGAYAGLVLASLGADVCQWNVGLNRRLDATESSWFDRGRSQIVEHASETDDGNDGLAGLAEVVRRADVIITDVAPRSLRSLGLPDGDDAVRAHAGRFVHVAITSFGLDSPYSDYEMCDITDWAASGLAYATRRDVPTDDIERYTPVLPGARQPDTFAGVAAAFGAIVGLLTPGRSTRSILVDVSRQQALASIAHYQLPLLLNEHFVIGDSDARSKYGFLVPTRGGDSYIRPVEELHWRRLFEWMGSPDWSITDGEPIYRTAPDLVRTLISEWAGEFTRDEFVVEGQRRGVPTAVPRDLGGLLAWSQPRERGAFVQIERDGRQLTAPRIPTIDDRPLPPPAHALVGEVVERWRTRHLDTTR